MSLQPGDAWGVAPESTGTGSPYGDQGDRLTFSHSHGRRHEYKYLAADLFTDRAISELPMRDVQFGWGLNKPGEFSGSVSIPAFGNLRKYFDATIPAKTALYVIRDGVPVWGGIIWKRSFSSDSKTLKIEADTWDSYMYHRILDETFQFIRDLTNDDVTKRYEGVEQIEVFRILWRHMSKARNGNIGVQLGDAVSPIKRGLYFSGWDFKTYSEHIDELVKKTDSFEWLSTVGLSESGTTIERRIEFAYPKFGRKWQDSKLIWEFPGWSLKYSWDADADKAATGIFVLGGGEGENKSWQRRVNSQALDEGWLRLDQARPHTTVWDANILRAHGAKYLVAYAPPISSFSMAVHPRRPLDFGDYFLGDEVQLIIDDDLFNNAGIPQTDLLARIKGLTVKPNDEGLEELTPEVVIAIRDLNIIDPDDESSDLVPDNWPGPTIESPNVIPDGEDGGGDGGAGGPNPFSVNVLDEISAARLRRGSSPNPEWDQVRYWGGSYD